MTENNKIDFETIDYSKVNPKKSTHSLWTMLAGAVSNCIMNYFLLNTVVS